MPTLEGVSLPTCSCCIRLSAFLQLAEFESDAVVVGDRRYVARLLSYPTVCVKRDFLDAAVAKVVAEQTEQKRSASPSPVPSRRLSSVCV